MLGKIESIKEVFDVGISPTRNTLDGNLGFSQMVKALSGYYVMDGFEVKTTKHTYYVLIDNEQSCCESWGTISSEDNLKKFIGADLLEVNLTDKALNKQKVEESNYYCDEGGIQFVDFVTTEGVLQLAVYNAHNGYYGHPIVVAKDDDVLLDCVL